jgi:hypothetical protein
MCSGIQFWARSSEVVFHEANISELLQTCPVYFNYFRGMLRRLVRRSNIEWMESATSLTGEWIGHYTGHYDEVIRISQGGDEVEAVKITGDDHVPAGAVTWRANLKTGRGEGQVAEREFRNPRFIPGKLTILSPDRIIFVWDKCGQVEYRRDD